MYHKKIFPLQLDFSLKGFDIFYSACLLALAGAPQRSAADTWKCD